MPIPKHNEMYNEILMAVADGEAHSIESICDFVAKQKGVTDEERAVLLENGNAHKFDYRVGWGLI